MVLSRDRSVRRLHAARPAASGAQPIGERNRALESCRGIAAVMVLLYHVAAFTHWPIPFAPRLLVSNGDAGVTLFFVLSGFLLWRPFAESIWRGERTWEPRHFLLNRTLRIVPAYWVALTVVLAAGGFAGASIGQYLLVQNYRRSSMFSGIAPAWSLGLEVAFYLLLPLVGMLGLRWSRRVASGDPRGLAFVQYGMLAGWIGVSLVFKIVAYGVWHRAASDAFVFFSFPSKMHLFGFGMLLAVWHARSREPGLLAAQRPWLAPSAGALIVAAAVSSRYSSALSAIWFDTVCGVGFTLLVYPLIFSAGEPGRLRRSLSWGPLVWLGTISYSLYLWHHPLIGWMAKAGWLGSSLGSFPINVILALTVSVVVAWASYGLVEYPFLRMRRSWTRRARRERSEAGDVIVLP